MFWETLWAQVLGFALSGAVQAFVSRGEMRRAVGDHAPRSLAKASFFGAISSSCSYASSADFTAAMVFLLASTNLAAALVPTTFWRSLFLTGHGSGSSLENVVLGPFLAIISFVCSVGNVPLASALWEGGISFGGVVSFVFADLITLPQLSIYRRYYGLPITLRLLGIFGATMSLAGLAVEYLFRAVGIPDPSRPRLVAETGFRLDYTLFLNIAALVAFAVIYRLYRTRDTGSGRYAKDPVCGMPVEPANAAASIQTADGEVSFCSDGCRDHYLAERQRAHA